MSQGLADDLQRYIAGRHPAATIADFQFMVSGWESDVYTFTLHLPAAAPRFLILRLYHGDGADAKVIREARGLRQLHHARYPVPAMLFHETDGAILGHPFTIMDKLDGHAMWPILAGATATQVNVLLDRFGGLLARLHQLDWSPFTDDAERYKAKPAAVLEPLFAASRQMYAQFNVEGFLAVIDWLELHAPEIAVQPAVVHLDFHANNVLLCSDDQLAVIDWTQITVADERADLTWTLMIMSDFGQPEWGERILRAYGLAAQKPVEQLDYFNVIAYTKLLASTVISLRAGPNALGLRPQDAESLRQQVPILTTLARRLQDITGLVVPEVEIALRRISQGAL